MLGAIVQKDFLALQYSDGDLCRFLKIYFSYSFLKDFDGRNDYLSTEHLFV